MGQLHPFTFYMKLSLKMEGTFLHGSNLGLALSIFLTIAITVERHQSVCDPLNYEARVVSR